MKKGAEKAESEEEKKSLGKVVGWEREDEEKAVEDGEQEEEEEEEEEEKWKNPYLLFLDNLDDSDEEEEVSSFSFTLNMRNIKRMKNILT